MRSIWKGHIRFSLVTIPIQLFSAVETKNNVSFRQIHKADNGRVGYNKVCRECDTTLSKNDIVKGYEYEDGQYVVFTEEELDGIRLDSTRAIDITAFIDLTEVHPSRFEAVYFLGPNGDVAQDTFTLLRESLAQTNKAGIGRLILRDREDVVLVAPYKQALILYKLRYPYEIRSVDNVPDIKERKVEEAQMELAKTLIASMTTSFEKINFEDHYMAALNDLVQDKIQGKEIIRVDEEEIDTPVVDIMDALKSSIEAAKKMKKGA